MTIGLFPGELKADATVGGCIDIFENADSGIIHFDVEVKKSNDPNILSSTYVDSKAIYYNIDNDPFNIGISNFKFENLFLLAVISRFP